MKRIWGNSSSCKWHCHCRGLGALCALVLALAPVVAQCAGRAPALAAASSPAELALQVGEVTVLAIPDVARVAVGDGHVINAVTTDEKEVIVFARNEGLSSLQVWKSGGQRSEYLVQVSPEGARQVLDELHDVLGRIPGVRLATAGDKLIVEGDELSDDDIARVNDLAGRYPQLVNLTGRVGWDSMVLLDVQVVELPRSQLQELGLRWSGSSLGGLNAGVAWDGGSSRFAQRPGESVLDIGFPATVAAGYFGANALLSAQIQAMAQEGSALVLAQPQLLARSGATAEFLAGGEVPYATTDANGNTNTQFKPYGVSLRITPQVERNGAVRSRIEVEVSAVDNSIGAASGGPALKTRRAATEFNVRSGQTLVLAGFLSRDANAVVDRVPLLGSLPLVGELFTSRRFQRQDTELAIFVTPMLVSASHPAVSRRVQAAGELLDQQFPDEPRLLTGLAMRPRGAETSPGRSLLAPAVPLGAPVKHPLPWNPWSGGGSQWNQESDDAAR